MLHHSCTLFQSQAYAKATNKGRVGWGKQAHRVIHCLRVLVDDTYPMKQSSDCEI